MNADIHIYCMHVDMLVFTIACMNICAYVCMYAYIHACLLANMIFGLM